MERKFLRTPLITSLLAVLLHASSSQIAAQNADKARQVWAEAIAAKGGETRLDAVRSILVRLTSEYTTANGQKKTLRRTSLSVLPDLYWSFDDYGAEPLGKLVKILNFETGQMILTKADVISPKLVPVGKAFNLSTYENADLSLLLETKWLKPIPKSLQRVTVLERDVDLVKTEISGRSVDFYLDPSSHLPIQVTFYLPRRGGGTSTVTHRLSDYRAVDGVMMPTLISYDIEGRNGSPQKAEVQLNVDYTEQIFSEPKGPFCSESWRNYACHRDSGKNSPVGPSIHMMRQDVL